MKANTELAITIAGVEREVEAAVEYHYAPPEPSVNYGGEFHLYSVSLLIWNIDIADALSCAQIEALEKELTQDADND